ncbi:hypothetical protein SO802_008842 [Lithocarpus litseifolius]|uniref:Neprosin PEP catalytic domain-containing protein n=1 Tax=Lithocarpus litseifolius TaxID=425828 RepID=A0AAW2DDL8_9ROSI
MTADINGWNPHTQEENEFSLSQFWLANGAYGQDLDSIEAGIMIAMGARLTPYSKYDGDQFALKFYVWKHTTTQMGSGHFAEEGPGKASFFKNLNVIDGLKIPRGPRDTTTFMTKPNCYNILDYGGFFYYGGPGRNSNCP